MIGLRRINVKRVGAHEIRQILGDRQREALLLPVIKHAVFVCIVLPRMPNGSQGVGWKVGAIGNEEGQLVGRQHITVVKALNAAAHQGWSDVVEEEGVGHVKVTNNILTSQRNHLNPEIDGRATGWNVPRETGNTVVEDRGGGVFVPVNQETNEGLSGPRRALVRPFKAHDHLHRDEFTRLKIGKFRVGSDAVGKLDTPFKHFDVVLDALVVPKAKDVCHGKHGSCA